MSQATTAGRGEFDAQETSVTHVTDAAERQTLLTLVQDENCRAILDSTYGTPASAKELASDCDIALSTTYRNLDRLTDAGLLEERTRVCRSGKHTAEYRGLLEDVMLSVTGEGGPDLHVVRRPAAGTMPAVLPSN
jgi:DNA-binding transcriptional ArsR family regulator